MDKHNYINNIYKVSKYLQKYVNNNDDFYLQKINNYIEKTYANQQGGVVWDEVQQSVKKLIDTVEHVISVNIAFKQQLKNLKLPKLNLLGASEYQIAYEIVDKNPELGINVEDLAKMSLTGTILIEESPSDVAEFFHDIEGYDSEKRNKVLDAYTNLKKRHLPTAPQLPPYTEPLPKARSLLLSPSPSLSQPAPSLQSAPPQEQLPIHKSLKDMTSADVAAEIAKVEGCQQYEADWAKSDIDGLNVIGCNEEELNEYIIDIPNVAGNPINRSNILKRLMELKDKYDKQPKISAPSQAPVPFSDLTTEQIIDIVILPLSSKKYKDKLISAQITGKKLEGIKLEDLNSILKGSDTSTEIMDGIIKRLWVLKNNPTLRTLEDVKRKIQEELLRQLAPVPNFGTTLLVQAVKINSLTHMRLVEDDKLSQIDILRYPLLPEDETIIKKKINELVKDKKIDIVIQSNPTTRLGGTPKVNIFVNFEQNVDIQPILEAFNENKNAVIKLSNNNTYRLFAIYQTQREEIHGKSNEKYDKENEKKKVEVNKRAYDVFITSITPDLTSQRGK
jgi:hypothetical protein